jgi:hypothetical protein
MPIPEAVENETPAVDERRNGALTKATTTRGIYRALPEKVRVQLPKQSTHGNGRSGDATDLTEQLANQICSVIRSTGCSLSTAARFVNKRPDVVNRWMHHPGEPYETFALEVRKSQAHWEVRLALAVVHAGTRDDARQRPELAMQMLERRLPKTYGRAAMAAAAATATVNLTQIIKQIEERPVVDPRDALVLTARAAVDDAVDDETPDPRERAADEPTS